MEDIKRSFAEIASLTDHLMGSLPRGITSMPKGYVQNNGDSMIAEYRTEDGKTYYIHISRDGK
jgi:hypothetical protein